MSGGSYTFCAESVLEERYLFTWSMFLHTCRGVLEVHDYYALTVILFLSHCGSFWTFLYIPHRSIFFPFYVCEEEHMAS